MAGLRSLPKNPALFTSRKFKTMGGSVSKNTKIIKNVIRGIGSTVIVCPPRRSYTVNRSDADALRQDWVKVGRDLSTAISKSAKSE